MIGANAYYVACCLKKTQVFAVSMKNIQYQVEKKVRTKTNAKSIVHKKYHDFLNIFLKKNLDIFSLY